MCSYVVALHNSCLCRRFHSLCLVDSVADYNCFPFSAPKHSELVYHRLDLLPQEDLCLHLKQLSTLSVYELLDSVLLCCRRVPVLLTNTFLYAVRPAPPASHSCSNSKCSRSVGSSQHTVPLISLRALCK